MESMLNEFAYLCDGLSSVSEDNYEETLKSIVESPIRKNKLFKPSINKWMGLIMKHRRDKAVQRLSKDLNLLKMMILTHFN